MKTAEELLARISELEATVSRVEGERDGAIEMRDAATYIASRVKGMAEAEHARAESSASRVAALEEALGELVRLEDLRLWDCHLPAWKDLNNSVKDRATKTRMDYRTNLPLAWATARSLIQPNVNLPCGPNNEPTDTASRGTREEVISDADVARIVADFTERGVVPNNDSAMALVKRFNLDLDSPKGGLDDEWCAGYGDDHSDSSNPIFASSQESLNRAIVECVAKLHSSSGGK